jgi:D-amino-acid oxidase
MVADKSRRTPAFNEMLDRAARLSNRAFQDLVGDRYGVRWIENYLLLAQPPTDAPGSRHDLYPDWKVLGPGEHPFSTPFVTRYMTMLIEPPVYLNALVEDVQRAAGTIIVRDFADREAILSLPEAFVFNCTGLGSAALFGDTELIPVKGQLSALVPQPEIGYIMMKDDLYMFPRRDGIVLGGTHERGVSSLEPNLEAAKSVIAAHQAIFRQMS